eukprot:6655194-Prymnesium_polylepis.1
MSHGAASSAAETPSLLFRWRKSLGQFEVRVAIALRAAAHGPFLSFGGPPPRVRSALARVLRIRPCSASSRATCTMSAPSFSPLPRASI